MTNSSNHKFHIPVLGTGFTIDSPVKVAQYGISSVISMVDDQLIEDLRKHYSNLNDLEYTAIKRSDEDSRARRITAYLNLLNRLVNRQIDSMKSNPLDPEEANGKYFEMLPQGELKQLYLSWKDMAPGSERDKTEQRLKESLLPGSIDVNIMTKLDGERTTGEHEDSAYYSDATSALRGFAKSDLQGSVVFSAGMNPRLFSTLGDYNDFYADENGSIRKKIVLKVSDYRSALIQGLMLAKKGLWISEFRIESGLNCGGHAFATKGNLMGPILQEFHDKRQDLYQALFKAFSQSDKAPEGLESLDMAISVQGGVGTSQENDFLMDHYHMDSIGWGTPFMLVPEATTLDDEHLEKLKTADEKQVFLSQASPLGVLFWNIKDSASELMRKLRIKEGNPGVKCKQGFLALNKELTEKPVCTASKLYQKLKVKALEEENLEPSLFMKLKERVLAKSCICFDLGSGATRKIGSNLHGHTALTPGPNIVNFSKVSSLKEMVSHIYGKINLMTNPKRPHVFIRELELYVEYIKAELENRKLGINVQKKKYFGDFQKNLLEGVEYYSAISKDFLEEQRSGFQESLQSLKSRILGLSPQIEGLN